MTLINRLRHSFKNLGINSMSRMTKDENVNK